MRSVRAVLWVLAAAGYLAFALPRFLLRGEAGSFAAPRPFHTSDTYFDACAHIGNGTEIVGTAIRRLSDGPIIIYYREDDPESSLVSMVLRYLSWPRQFYAVAVDRPRMARPPPSTAAASIFCHVRPPSISSHSIVLSDVLVISPNGQ